MNGSDRMGMDKRKYFLLKTVIFLFMLAAALIALFPFYWMFVTAVKRSMRSLLFRRSCGQVNLSGAILQLLYPEHRLGCISETALL